MPSAWEIPASAVLVRDEMTFCYEVRDGKTHRLPLRLGLRDGNRVEVLKMQAPSQNARRSADVDQSNGPGNDRGD